jgi:hypothetical protein
MDITALQVFVYTNEYQESRLLTKKLYIFTRFMISVKVIYSKYSIATVCYRLGVCDLVN